MNDQRFHYNLNEFQATSTTRHWWPKAIATFMTLGGIYGAAIGSAINTTAGAADIIGIAAAVMAVLCGVPGARFGLFFGALNRTRFGRLFLGLFSAMGGAMFGGFLGMVAVMPFGAILGAVAGWFFTWAVLPRGFFRLLLGGVLGLVLGACIGVMILALSQSRSNALAGIAWGLGIGAIVGPLPFLFFAKMMKSLAPRRYTEGEIIDVNVVDLPKDKIEGPPDDRPRSL
jgi:hypothetical protein